MTQHFEDKTLTSRSPANGNGLAIASLILGILSVTVLFIISGIPAIITGILALRRGQKERAMSIAGIVLGSIGIVLSLLFILAIIFVVYLGITTNSYEPWIDPADTFDMPVESIRV